MSRECHYKWMREDENYREAFKTATAEAVTVLEDEMIRRAHNGVSRVVRYKGKVVGTETEYSDQLLIAALKAHAPEKYRERATIAHTGPDGGPVFDVLAIRQFIQSEPNE